jgi:hypothetical protein
MRPEERTRLAEVIEALGGVDTARLFKDVLLGLFDRYQGDIRQRAASTDLGELTRQLRI